MYAGVSENAMSRQCRQCGAQIEDQASICVVCGVENPKPVNAPQGPTETMPSAPELFSSRGSSEEANLAGIGGWLILPAIGIAFAPFLNLHAMVRDFQVLTGQRTGEALSTHMSLHLLIIFELLTNSVFMLYSVLLNILLYSKKKAFPVAMMIFLAANFLASSISFIALAGMHYRPQGDALFRTIVAAAIWIPYFLRSRRIALTFVR